MGSHWETLRANLKETQMVPHLDGLKVVLWGWLKWTESMTVDRKGPN